MRIFTVLPFGPEPEILRINKQVVDFFRNNCTNTTFLKENNISLIYSPIECKNHELKRLHNNIYKVL